MPLLSNTATESSALLVAHHVSPIKQCKIGRRDCELKSLGFSSAQAISPVLASLMLMVGAGVTAEEVQQPQLRSPQLESIHTYPLPTPPLPPGGVPRQVLMIDLQPVLAPFLPAAQPSALSDSSVSNPSVSNSGPVPNHLEIGPTKPSPTGEEFPHGNSAHSNPQLIPPSPPLHSLQDQPTTPSSRLGRELKPADVQPRHWQGSYPSLGSEQFDLQLRRYLVYLETIGQPDLLVVGGQGAVQGINPLALQESLGDRGYANLKVFNWGMANTTAQTLEVLLSQLLTAEQLPKLVIWVDHAPAFNGARQDIGFAQLQTSPGYRLLQRRLLPQLSTQDATRARALQHSLRQGMAAQPSGKQHLPEQLRAIALQKSIAPQGSPVSNSQASSRIAQLQSHSPPTTNLLQRRSSPLPQLKPQPPLPSITPTISPRTLSSQTPSPHIPSLHAPLPNPQSSSSGFRLINWCRPLNGPCQAPPNSSLTPPITATPSWRQTTAMEHPQRHATAASLTSAPSIQSLQLPSQPTAKFQLPDWPETPQQRRFLQALGFQSISQELPARLIGPGSRPPQRLLTQAAQSGTQDRDYRNFSLQGDQTRALHRLLQYAQQQDMAIAFVTLPLSDRYRDAHRQNHEQALSTYLEVATQVTPLHQIRLPPSFQWNDALFAQPNRLNRYGAAVLSWQIGQTLQSNLLQKLR